MFFTHTEGVVMSLYSHAGVSRQNGDMKVRFANDALRVKVLAKNGHKDIDIVELREPMTKEAAVAYLFSIDFANGNKDVQAAMEAAADKRGVNVVAAKAVAPKKTKAAVTAVADEKVMSVKEANAAILKQLADKEAAPF
jgi:hypothetical protein